MQAVYPKKNWLVAAECFYMVVLSVRSAPNQYRLVPASLYNRHILYNIKGKEVALELSFFSYVW